MEDITQLLNSNPNGTTTSDITSQITQIMAWVIVPSVILTIVFIVFFVMYIIRKRKIENAIIEIRDLLIEIKLAQQPPNKNQAPVAAADPYVVPVIETKDNPPQDIATP